MIGSCTGLAIRQVDGWTQTVDIHAREGGGGSRPVVVCFHGGGWRTGSPAGYGAVAKHLLERLDVVVVSASYHLVDRASFPTQVQDAANAVRWVRQNADELRIDPRRLAVCGSSAGGYLATMVALTHGDPQLAGGAAINDESAEAQALICQWGPIDFIARWYGNGGKAGAEAGLLGTDYLHDPALYHHASALAHVTAAAPPALFVFGRRDPMVHQQQGELGAAAWARHGLRHRLLLLDRIGHGEIDPADVTASTAAVGDFVTETFA